MTFTLGSAAVYMANVFAIAACDYPVNLPATRTGEVLFVFPGEGNYGWDPDDIQQGDLSDFTFTR